MMQMNPYLTALRKGEWRLIVPAIIILIIAVFLFFAVGSTFLDYITERTYDERSLDVHHDL